MRTALAAKSTADTAIERLLYWVEERESIRRRKEAGKPPPWTSDPILRDHKFCCVFRQDDRTSRWIHKAWLKPRRSDPDLWFCAVIGRLFNNVETLRALQPVVLPWDAEAAAELLDDRARVAGLYSDAYRTSGGFCRSAGDRVRHISQIKLLFNPLWAARARVRPRQGDRLRDVFDRLAGFCGLGAPGGDGFLRGQIIHDLKAFAPLADAEDWLSFVTPGPGSLRGLSRLLGRPTNYRWSEKEWRRELNRLFKTIEPELVRMGIDTDDVCNQTLQHWCCEVDKYLRAESGEGKLRTYKPRRRRGLLHS